MVSKERLRAQLGKCVIEARIPEWAEWYTQGKVRGIYRPPGSGVRILVCTDRQSAFDQVLGAIPFKGQVLDRITRYWFEVTEDIIPNHVLAVLLPNVMVVKELRIFPVEIVVRAYLTGSTDTSAWVNYSQGRDPYGLHLPPGLAKNTMFEAPVITPTSKSKGHDEPMSVSAVVERGLMAPDVWEEARRKALALFQRGVELAARKGLILVDTKYEMGQDEMGRIVVADEIHTPDSSRYWIAPTYPERFARGEEPESLDKEFLRLWLKARGATADFVPQLDDDIRVEVAERYIDLCERITGQPFEPEDVGEDPLAEIRAHIAPFMPKAA